ncbi:cytochrome c oxidase subunit 7A2, mitochondrial-like [Babylonia areolata]|uniref:cytochrome c oxidase subunit 7A2, mitochondrial-like n=1 Tax=Babylonia areolata TaxID=304850 RepID=UPI003FD35F92
MLSRICARRFSAAASGQSSGIVPSTPRYKRIQDLQNAFCRDDGLLVWQKMGTKDKGMYYVTMLATVFGFVPALGTILKMSFPKKE